MTSRSRSRKARRSCASGPPFSAAGLMFDPTLSSKPEATDKAERGERFVMNVSPLDLRQQKFHSRFRGFDKVEVASLLSAVADDYEAALRETDRLRQQLIRVE